MGARENGLTLEALAQRLETLERENAELRNEVVALRGSDTPRNEPGETRTLVPLRDGEGDSGSDGRVSRRAFFAKAGTAAAAALAAGVLLGPREAHAAAGVSGTGDPGVEGIANANVGTGVLGQGQGGLGYYDGVRGFGRGTAFAGVQGEGLDASAYGVRGANRNDGGTGVYGFGRGANGAGVHGSNPTGTGVKGEGNDGVVGLSYTNGYSGLYGRHYGSSDGPGVTGDGRGNWPGVWGRNPTADGVTGETSGAVKSGVYGRHNGTSGFGVTGDGKGETGAGVLGRNATGYGGQFEGGKAQLKLKPAGSAGKPGGAHIKGEIYMDSAGTLFVCVAGGTPGKWRKVTTSAV